MVQNQAGTARQFANTLSEIIETSGFKLNRISKLSGISNTYLNKLVQGHINRPGKDKIASILLALNYSISTVNEILAGYDYQPLNRLDIPAILINNQKRKIEGNTLSLYDHIHARLLLAVMEQLDGTKVLVKGSPSALFMPEALYMMNDFSVESDAAARLFRTEFTQVILKERKRVFREACIGGQRFETFMCRKCLNDFFARAFKPTEDPEKDIRRRELMAGYFANVIGAITRYPELHRMRIIDRCTYFDFMIQGGGGPSPKVFFLGRKQHSYDNAYQHRNLRGFTSDSLSMLVLFEQEADICRQAADAALEADYPSHLIDYFFEKFESYGLRGELETAVAENLAGEDFLYF